MAQSQKRIGGAPVAAEALRQCEPQGDFAISMSRGVKHLSADTLARWARAAAAVVADFEAKRIRSGVETALAAARKADPYAVRILSHLIDVLEGREQALVYPSAP